MNQPELIVQLQQGDASAFTRLVAQWQELVFNTAIGIVQNVEDADDITQEVFIQVYKSISSFKGESKFSTLLYRIKLGKALDSTMLNVQNATKGLNENMEAAKNNILLRGYFRKKKKAEAKKAAELKKQEAINKKKGIITTPPVNTKDTIKQ